MLASLRLFKALPVADHTSAAAAFTDLARQTMPHGFVFSADVAGQYPQQQLLSWVNDLYGRNGEQLNASLHKSFGKVANAPMWQLLVEQVLHYMSTYGAQAFGIYSDDYVYVPAEALEVPELEADVRLTVIRGLTADELKVELLKLLSTGVALSEQSVKDCVSIAKFVGINAWDLTAVKNREVSVALYDELGLVPADPVEFLRYVVFKATGDTLLIKNRALVAKLRESDVPMDKILSAYDATKLATIFNRYKPLLLALRKSPASKRYINEVRRQARIHHKPMQEDYLNSVTEKLSKGEPIDYPELLSHLQSANVFRKIRLAYALKFRAGGPESILYRVRNGKSYAKEFSFDAVRNAGVKYDVVLQAIVEDIRRNVEGKKIFIPEGLRYALPATEKQFTGHLPTGTCVEVHEDLVVGVHWFNLDKPKNRYGGQVDLDLSIANVAGKIGWDARYRTDAALYSGDMTSAPRPHGASEVFRITGQGSWLMSVNYYNFYDGDSAPFKIIAGADASTTLSSNRVVDPNTVIAASNSVMDVKQKTLGLIVSDKRSKRFYFTEAEFMSGASARHTTASEHTRKYLVDYYENAISLNEVLEMAGATVVGKLSDEVDIDLSPEAIDKSTIINLIAGT